MAKLIYDYSYDNDEAFARFFIDTDVFTDEKAKVLLDFFSWNYDEEESPVEELMKKYAMKAIEVSSSEIFNTRGVIQWFAESEGFLPIDGSQGVELLKVSRFEFDDSLLDLTKSEK